MFRVFLGVSVSPWRIPPCLSGCLTVTTASYRCDCFRSGVGHTHRTAYTHYNGCHG